MHLLLFFGAGIKPIKLTKYKHFFYFLCTDVEKGPVFDFKILRNCWLILLYFLNKIRALAFFSYHNNDYCSVIEGHRQKMVILDVGPFSIHLQNFVS